jgi:nucleotide sugar dehydrogenase
MLEFQGRGSDGIMSDYKVLIIGLGEIGHSNAEYMTSLGLKVDGYDISDGAIQRAISDGVIRKKAASFSGYDFHVVCVSTHRQENMFMPYLNGLYEVAERLGREATPGTLLGIDSTVPRGTTSRIENMLQHKLHVVHVPHRYFAQEKSEHGVCQMRVIGAPRKCCMEHGKKFYGDVMKIPLFQVSSPDIAELTKVAENAKRFVDIAFAEELKMVCDDSGMSFAELRESINTKWNTKILEAKDGIGGHCLPKDSQMLLDLSRQFLQSSIIEAAKKVDSEYRVHIMKMISQKAAMIE